MTREGARRSVLKAIHTERDWQAQRISERQDDQQVDTDLLFLVGVLSKYLGRIATEGVEQSQGDEADWNEVAQGCVKLAAVAAAVAESLVSCGKVDTAIFKAAKMH